MPTNDVQKEFLRDSTITLRVSNSEHQRLIHEAAQAGLSLSYYIRDRLAEKTSVFSPVSGEEKKRGEIAAEAKKIRRIYEEKAAKITELIKKFGVAMKTKNHHGDPILNAEISQRILSEILRYEQEFQDSLNGLLAFINERQTHAAPDFEPGMTAGESFRSHAGAGLYEREEVINPITHTIMFRATVFGYLSGEAETLTDTGGNPFIRFRVNIAGGAAVPGKAGSVTVVSYNTGVADLLRSGKLVLAHGDEDVIVPRDDASAPPEVIVYAERISVHGVMLGVAEGNLVDDAEPFTSKAGAEMVRFKVAADSYAAGEKKTFFVQVVSRKEDYLDGFTKGTRVYVEGSQDVSLSRKDGKVWLNVSMYADLVKVIKKK